MRPPIVFTLTVVSMWVCCSASADDASSEGARTVLSADRRWASDDAAETPEFQRHVVPLFSKLGCNMRSCHGSFQGQNGFRLSLFGFEPELDRQELLEEDELSEGHLCGFTSVWLEARK